MKEEHDFHDVNPSISTLWRVYARCRLPTTVNDRKEFAFYAECKPTPGCFIPLPQYTAEQHSALLLFWSYTTNGLTASPLHHHLPTHFFILHALIDLIP